MDDKTLMALTQLAEKLGTTAEYLWGVMLKQAPISAFYDALLVLLTFTIMAVWTTVVVKKTKAKKEDSGYPWRSGGEWCDEAAFSAWASVVGLGVVAFIKSLSALKNITTAILNPEFWALSQILK